MSLFSILSHIFVHSTGMVSVSNGYSGLVLLLSSFTMVLIVDELYLYDHIISSQ